MCYIHWHNVRDKIGCLSVSFLRDTWGRVKIDGCTCVYAGLCVALCSTQTWGIDAVRCVHDDSFFLSPSLCLSPSVSPFLSCLFSLVTVDRFNTIEHLTGPVCLRQSWLPLLSSPVIYIICDFPM